MRVALNVEQLVQQPPGGTGRYVAELARLLPVASGAVTPDEPAGDTGVDLVTFTACHRHATVDRALERFSLGGAAGLDPVRLLLPRPVLYDTWNVFGVPSLELLHPRLRGVDVVHAPSLAVPPRHRAALVVTVHDAAPLLYPETYPWHGRFFHRHGYTAAAHRADAVIALTQAAADEISERTPVPADRICVVAHGVQQDIVEHDSVVSTRRALGLGDTPYVLWVGTLEPRKGLTTLVHAFAAVRDAGNLPHRLVIVGSKGWRDTAAEIKEPARALGDRVRFTDPVPDVQLRALYRGADLFAFPSRHEGFGLPLLEAMAQETAVVCSDIAVLREVALDAAAFVTPGDVTAWGDALVALLRDDAARATLARTGRARARGFTWERCAARTRQVYRSVV